MKKNKKQNIRLLALILILLLGIGFAALAANLKINGTLSIDSASWDVHFENVQVTEGSVEANPAPTSDDATTTEMTYTISFTKPGDFFEFTVDMVNDGTIDAMVDVVSNNAYESAASTTPITLPTYLTNTVTYEDGTPILQNQELLHGTSEKMKVRIEFKKDISVSDLPSGGDTSVVFKFSGSFKQADGNAISTYDWRLPEGRTKDNLQLGDEICIRNQCFNFLHYDGTNDEDIVMLAKYNLNVGDNTKGAETFKQDSDIRGLYDGFTTYGTVRYAASRYWLDGTTLKPEYGSGYPTDVYDNQYKTAPDFTGDGYLTEGYSIAYYVEEYKTILEEYGTSIKNARLLKYSEIMDQNIGCTYDISTYTGTCPTNHFITNTSYWTEILVSYGHFIGIKGNGEVVNGGFTYSGVRPVIVVSKTNI